MKKFATIAPAVAMTAVSMVLTLAVVVMWLGESMPWGVALVVGVGLDGGWLATLAYERRLAAQGDHNTPVTVVGWAFGAAATGVLVAHALGESSPGAWLAVAWLPLAAKALWLVHGLWERTALTPAAIEQIRDIQQDARDDAAVARARLRAQAGTEQTRLEAVTEAGARVARVQARTADRLAGAWSTVEAARQGDGTDRALSGSAGWDLPVWGPVEPLPARLPLEADTTKVDTPDPVEAVVDGAVYDQETDPGLSTQTAQVTELTPLRGGEPAIEVGTEVDAPTERLSAEAAKVAIEAAWTEGLTVREAADRATRAPSYVGQVYARLTHERGHQPSKGQTRIEVPAA